nr:unnamed protein product [Callosobruchus chinensis]
MWERMVKKVTVVSFRIQTFAKSLKTEDWVLKNMMHYREQILKFLMSF